MAFNREELVKTEPSPIYVDVNSVSKIAIFLEGIKVGRGGNINPLGTVDLENLWSAIHLLNGDERYKVMDRI